MTNKAVQPDIIGLTASILVWLGKQFARDSGIMEVVKGLNLENKEGVKPNLIKTRKTETGTDYIFSIPPGMTKNDFEKNRVAFETFTNSTIEVESAGKRLVIKSHKTEFKKKIAFNFDPVSVWMDKNGHVNIQPASDKPIDPYTMLHSTWKPRK